MSSIPLSDYVRKPLRITSEQFAADVDGHLEEVSRRLVVVACRSGPRLLIDAQSAFELAAGLFMLVCDAMTSKNWEREAARPARKRKPRRT